MRSDTKNATATPTEQGENGCFDWSQKGRGLADGRIAAAVPLAQLAATLAGLGRARTALQAKIS
jgi:hypothetical protein